MSFNGNFIGYFDNRCANGKNVHIKGNDKRTRIIVSSKKFARYTDNEIRVMALGNKIYTDTNVVISTYDLKKILEKYDIIEKK